MWHMIEINSTENAVIQNCVFDGTSYTRIHEDLYNEQIQLDRACEGSYGPVYNCDGTLIDFCKDGTVCRNTIIKNNIFRCAGFPAIGHHDDCAHNRIEISSNIFDGSSGLWGKSRGYIIFRSRAFDITVTNNAFFSPETNTSPNIGIIIENPDKNVFSVSNNTFSGYFER